MSGLLGGDARGGSAKRESRWLTPPYIVAALGSFDLDPCGAPNHPLAATTYLLESGEDGLRDEWFGRVWLNPPYGREAASFMRRLADHGNGTALIFARTDTRMFHDEVWSRASAVLFLKGRLSFIDAGGNVAPASAGAPSCLVAYGSQDADRLRGSGLTGHCVNLQSERLKEVG